MNEVLEYPIQADGLWTVSEGQQVLVCIQLPPYDSNRKVLVRGEIIEVLSQVCAEIPLQYPVCRVLLDLTRSYHPLLAQGKLEHAWAVELENGLPLDELDDDPEERELDEAYFAEHPPVNELDLHTVVKSCWPENLHGYHPAFDALSFAGLVPPSQWLGSNKPRAKALHDCWLHGEV
jgi:hypothetical protein